jgi:serine phosphatase RsbU (regulator of sigma subunit)
LGVREQVAYASRTIELATDERLVLLTDGLPEARDTAGEPLGYQALESMLEAEPTGEPPSSWLAELFDAVQKRTARTPEDDWTAALLVSREAGEAS